MSRFLIWGGGGHGKVIADLVRALGHEIVGFVDSDPARLNLEVEPGGGRVVMSEDSFLRPIDEGAHLPEGADAVALAIGDNRKRSDALRRLPPSSAPTLVHPTAVVSPSAQIGEGSVVFARAVIHASARLGAGVIVNTAAVVEHDCVVGDGAHLAPASVLAGGVRVGELSWIGAGAVVIQGRVVGREVMVGAGAAVVSDVPDRTTVIGVPAKRLPGD
ncbi:MAG: acetyltransferase [Gemmatimonadetes bacterium]|nr:acetyltransferase [Gemmatimonadota bacterium]